MKTIALSLLVLAAPSWARAESIPKCEARCATSFATCRASARCDDAMDTICRCGEKEAQCKLQCRALPPEAGPGGKAEKSKPDAGKVDPSVIAKEIRSRLGVVKKCYESALARKPELAGKVKVRFEVSEEGKVISAEAEEDTLEDATVVGCILSRVRSWRFSAPAGGPVQFSYPFVFESTK